MVPGLFGLSLMVLMMVVVACGGAAATPVPPTATTAPPPTAAVVAKAMTPIGGPGAVYYGKLEDLAGPAPTKDLGDADGNVPLDVIKLYPWIYESGYYNALKVKAKLDNPTPLVSSGLKFKLQYTCINRTLLPCKLMDAYFTKNVFQRTNGQVEIQVVSYPELGIAGPESLRLLADGTLGVGEIYGGFVSGELPVSEIFYFWGLYPSNHAEFVAQEVLLPKVDKIVSDGAKGAVVITHNWYSGNDQYLFSRKPLRTLEDFKGIKVRSHGTTLSDWINGMGGDAQFVPFAEVYTALERGVLDAAVTGATAGYGVRLYETTKYLVGPFPSFPADFILINKGVWDKFPADIQQIILEEGAKQELEALRLSPIHNELGLPINIKAGMEHIPFSPALQQYYFENAILKRMIPNWVKRVGGADRPEVALFNEVVGPVAGVKINPDATVVKVEGIKIGVK
jgi:TRAP-type C4-dicarboxylate transport system substrate-binding protein